MNRPWISFCPSEGRLVVGPSENWQKPEELTEILLGRGMIDFDKPVKVYLNLNLANRKVRPSLKELLEDFYERCDRERPVLAKVELSL